MIKRDIFKIISKRAFQGKAIIISGSRQTGKTTLMRDISKSFGLPVKNWNCDEPDDKSELENPSSTELKQMIGSNKIVIIDEAQRVKNIGVTAKLIVDLIPEVQLFITGSSSLDIGKKLQEPLTGRKFEYRMHPFSFSELKNHTSLKEEKRLLISRMIYGSYPEIVNNPGDEEDRLIELITSFLFKDVFELGNMRKPEVLDKLVKAIALQVGSQVSYREISDLIGLDKNTVSRYIDLLEQTYVIFSLYSFNRNLRNELKMSRKIYFWDNGIRNVIIRNFNRPDSRVDIGALWENYFIAERLKYLGNNGIKPNYYFWRTRQKQEIDYIEEYAGKISAYECKWNPKAKGKRPKTFVEAYENIDFNLANRMNYSQFVLGDKKSKS